MSLFTLFTLVSNYNMSTVYFKCLIEISGKSTVFFITIHSVYFLLVLDVPRGVQYV